jgi:hypothetical protein
MDCFAWGGMVYLE